MKAYQKEDKNVTFIIPETQEEAQRIKDLIHDNAYIEWICQKAEIVPDIFAVGGKQYEN